MIVKKVPAKSENERKRARELIAYILNPETEDQNEKCAFSQCDNFCNNDSPERMRAEMFALAAACGSAIQKTILQHWVLSWTGLEKPESKIILQVSCEFMNEMGMQNNQRVIGIHVNTENLHAHIAVSRVDPAMMTLVDNSNDIYKAHQVIAKLENKYGFLPEHNAMFKWSPFKGVYNNPDYNFKNSMSFPNISPEPVTVLLSKDVDPGDIPGMKRKGNIYYSKCNNEITGVIDDGKLHLFKWAYKDIIRHLLYLKEEKQCRIVVQNNLTRLFSTTKMTRKESEDFAKANFNKQGYDLFNSNKVVPMPDDPLTLSRILSIIPSIDIKRKEIDDIYKHYKELKIRFRKKNIPESRVKVVAVLMMRKEAVSRGDIEEVLRRDGVDTPIARNICSWLYSDQGNAALYSLEKAGLFDETKNVSRTKFSKKPVRKVKRIMKRKNYDLSADDRVMQEIKNSVINYQDIGYKPDYEPKM